MTIISLQIYNIYQLPLLLRVFMTFSLSSILLKSIAALTLTTLTMTMPLSANAGFLDSIYDVQNLLDHDNVTTTQLYSAHRKNVKKDIIQNFELDDEE